MAVCATIIILLAEHLCVRRELGQEFKPIVATEDPDDQGSEPADDTRDIELTPTAN
jgi:hypothetical protein